jgi:hypothetical protein
VDSVLGDDADACIVGFDCRVVWIGFVLYVGLDMVNYWKNGGLCYCVFSLQVLACLCCFLLEKILSYCVLLADLFIERG